MLSNPVGNPPFSSWSQIYRNWSSSYLLHTVPARAGGQWVIHFRNRATVEWKELAASDHIWCCSVSVFCPWVEPACWRVWCAQGCYAHFSCYLPLVIFFNLKLIFLIDGWGFSSDLIKTIFGWAHTSLMHVFHLFSPSLGKNIPCLLVHTLW